MPTRPITRPPTWATSGTGIAETVDPGATYQSDGYSTDERPPAQFWNWYNNAVGEWARYSHELLTELRNAHISDSGNYVIAGLTPSKAGTTVSVLPGAMMVFETAPLSGEPSFQPTYSASTVTLTVAGASLNVWTSIFAQRNATGGITLSAIVGGVRAIVQPSNEQVLVALYTNSVLYDARKFAYPATRTLASDDAEYLDNSLQFNPAGDLVVKSRVLGRASAQSLGRDYTVDVTIPAANLVVHSDAAFAGGTNYYVYAYKPYGEHVPQHNARSNAWLYLSITPPAAGKRIVALTGTETSLMFNTLSMPGPAVLLGAIRRNAANNGWEQWVTEGNEIAFGGNRLLFTFGPVAPAALVSTGSAAIALTGVPQARTYGLVASGEIYCALNTSWELDISFTGSSGLHFRHLAHNVAGFRIGISSSESDLFWATGAVNMAYTSTTVQTSYHATIARVARVRF